jgi:hypothetical protein
MMAGLAILFIIYFAIIGLMIASMWKIYSKANQPGWACIVPIYNLVVLLNIIGKPTWWIILMIIPIVNLVILIIVYHNLSLSFGKDGGFTAGLILLGFVFFPILAFGDAQYIGPGGQSLVEPTLETQKG